MGTRVRGNMKRERAKVPGDPYIISAAIDLGTSSSCYAFCYRTTEQECDIRMNKNWTGTENFESYKAPTAILTEPDSDGKFLAFGFEAVREYKELTDDGQTTDKNLYHDFKMQLYTEKDLSVSSSMVTSTSGTKRPLIDVFVMTLRYLKEHMLDTIKHITQIPKSNEIRWVICVPTIWSDTAKQFMRNAAYKADLITQEQSSQLLLVLESSAAALYCRQQDANAFIGGPEFYNMRDGMQFDIGMKYIIVDAGGGTVDFTAQKILPNDEVIQLSASNGGDWGGRNVDANFKTLLIEVLGTNFIEKFIRERPLNWYEFMTAFEKAKKGVEIDGKGINLQIPALFERMFMRWERSDLGETLESFKTSKGIGESNGYLRISQKTTESLFHPVLQKILDHLKNNCLNSNDLKKYKIDCIFLVGGFSSCKLLHHHITQSIKDITILTPEEAQIAIVKGAVLYCNKPEMIKRRAKKTYGATTFVPFDDTKHPEHKKRIEGNDVYCTDVFLPFFKKNEIIDFGVTGQIIAEPAHKNATNLTVEFYSLDRELGVDESLFIDSEEFHLEGQTRVELSGISNKKEVLITFHFGDDVHVTAKNLQTEDEHRVNLNLQFTDGA